MGWVKKMPKKHQLPTRRNPSSASASSDSAASTATVESISTAKREVMSAVAGTDNGLNCTESQRVEIESMITRLEALNPTPEPASSPLVDGNWRVVYSTAPPPSNGSLGPFKGTAFQDINLADNSYANVLTVPPNDWLGATLVAGWKALKLKSDDERGDGRLWVVDFKSVTVRLFGFDLFTKTFTDTTRVWDQTYVDDDTRVVRAARTMDGLMKEGARGRKAIAGDEDDCVFLMVREIVKDAVR